MSSNSLSSLPTVRGAQQMGRGRKSHSLQGEESEVNCGSVCRPGLELNKLCCDSWHTTDTRHKKTPTVFLKLLGHGFDIIFPLRFHGQENSLALLSVFLIETTEALVWTGKCGSSRSLCMCVCFCRASTTIFLKLKFHWDSSLAIDCNSYKLSEPPLLP